MIPPLRLVCFWLWLRMLELRFDIWSNEMYADQCEAGGIFDSVSVSIFRSAMSPQRVRLAVLQQRRDTLLAQRGR